MKRRKCLGADGLEQAPISTFSLLDVAAPPSLQLASLGPPGAPRDLGRHGKPRCDQALCGAKCVCARSATEVASQLTAIAAVQQQQLVRHAAASNYLPCLANSLALMGPLLRSAPHSNYSVSEATRQIALTARYRPQDAAPAANVIDSGASRPLISTKAISHTPGHLIAISPIASTTIPKRPASTSAKKASSFTVEALLSG